MKQLTFHFQPASTGTKVHDLARSLSIGGITLSPWEGLDVADAVHDPHFHREVLLLQTYPVVLAALVAHDDQARDALKVALLDRDVKKLLKLTDYGKHGAR